MPRTPVFDGADLPRVAPAVFGTTAQPFRLIFEAKLVPQPRSQLGGVRGDLDTDSAKVVTFGIEQPLYELVAGIDLVSKAPVEENEVGSAVHSGLDSLRYKYTNIFPISQDVPDLT